MRTVAREARGDEQSALRGEFANHEVEGGEPGEKHTAFKAHGDAVEATKLQKQRAIRSSSFDGAHLHAQHSHLGADRVLRQTRAAHHQSDQKGGGRPEAGARGRSHKPRAKQTAARGPSKKVHPPKRVTATRPGFSAALKNAEGAGRYHETEEDVGTEPQAQG